MGQITRQAVRSRDKSDGQRTNGSYLAPKAAAEELGAKHPLLHLQRIIGNQAVEQVLRAGMGRPAVSAPGDSTEREARQVADAVMRGGDGMRGDARASRSGTGGMGRSAAGTSGAATQRPRSGGVEEGKPLDPATRGAMEARFGVDFGNVRTHTSTSAQSAAEALHARAFTVGEHIGFGRGEYRPTTPSGRRLLAHELAHVVQQRASATPVIQRDLKAYNQPKTEVISTSTNSGRTTYVTASAEAPALRTALRDLITTGRIRVVDSADGSTSWFAAEHHRNVQVNEIRAALNAAGYQQADRLAEAIHDKQGEHLFADKKLMTMGISRRTVDLGTQIETQRNRAMTEWEIREARRVFGDAIDYSVVTVSDESLRARIGSAGGYARVVGNTMVFPPGASRNMSLMIHELTHIWQYQTIGWSYARRAIWVHATQGSKGYNYSEKGKTAEQSLIDARANGKRLQDYNMEQQGDIVRDYYIRLRDGLDTSAWDPFIADIRGK